MSTIKTVCGMCNSMTCGIEVQVQDGRIVDIRGARGHPLSRGALCPQARAAAELAVDPNRLTFPARRLAPKGTPAGPMEAPGAWQRITWDEALETIAERIAPLRAAGRPEALAVYQGRGLLKSLRMGWPQHFLNLYGTPNLVRNEHMCSMPTGICERLTYGAHDLYGFEPDQVGCMVFWGANPATSAMTTMWRDVRLARARGAKLIVVDPRRSQPAEQADIHAAPRPGTDLALALGLIQVIIAEGLYDAAFVQEWTTGFDQVVSAARPYTPGRVEAITGVPAALISELARMYASSGPAYLMAGNALEHHSNSTQTLRAIMILRSITGNLDVPGGHLFMGPLGIRSAAMADRAPAGVKSLGEERYPFLWQAAHFSPGDVLLDAILEGRPYPIEALIASGGNLALDWPNSRRVTAALGHVPFLAVMETRMTATAQYADLLLPAANTLEQPVLVSQGGAFGEGRPQYHLTVTRPVIDPGERHSDWWFWAELGKRLGMDANYPADEAAAIGYALEPLGITYEDLLHSEDGLFCGPPRQYRSYLAHGFATPSGKVELASSVLQAAGYAAVPEYIEPGESPASTPETAQQYPLVFTAGRRESVYTHSQHRTLPSLRRQAPEPLAEIHPDTAACFGIAQGDWILVESRRGSITLRAALKDGMRPGTVSLLHGWDEANANVLTDDAGCDPVLACPPLRSGLCSIRKATRPEGSSIGAETPPAASS